MVDRILKLEGETLGQSFYFGVSFGIYSIHWEPHSCASILVSSVIGAVIIGKYYLLPPKFSVQKDVQTIMHLMSACQHWSSIFFVVTLF